MALPPRVELPSADSASSPPHGAAAAPDAALATLFQQQVAVLEAHLAIIRQQNELLARGGISPHAITTPAPLVVTPPTSEARATSNGHAVTAPNGHAANDRDAALTTVASSSGEWTVAEVEPRVLGAVARISASPPERLKPTTRLGGDLGFDSLMVVELASQLAEDFPGLGMLPKTLFARDLSIHEVARHVASTLAAAEDSSAAAADDKPARRFARYRATERPAPLPAGVPALDAALVGPVLIVGTEQTAPVANAVLNRLRAAGLEARIVAADALADASAGANLVDLRGLAPEARLDDAASLLSAASDAFATAAAVREGRPAGWLLVHAGTTGIALTGFAKALAREWEGVLVRALELSAQAAPAVMAERIATELLSTDASPEVRWDEEARLVPALAPAPLSAADGLRPDDVVLVTGGAGGVGAHLARALVGRAKLALLGRRPADDPAVASLLSSLADGRGAIYVSCDVRSRDGVRDAVAEVRRRLGPITVAIHAAGEVRDAAVERKSADDVRAVLETKLAGAVHLWGALEGDPLRAFVGLGSWAGRFGNAHQTDYAAANDALARWSRAVGAVRRDVHVAVLDLPPWQGIGMAANLPDAVRRELERRVPFVPPADGVSRVLAELGAAVGSGGELLIGPDADLDDALEAPARLWQLEVSTARSPYLLDHQIDGRPVLPLAAAVARMADAQRATTGQPSGAPVALRDLRVVDGVVLEGPTATARAALRSTHGARGTLTLELLRVDGRGRVAVRATGSHASPVAPLVAPVGLAAHPDGDLPPIARFYADHTFHGPALQAIREVRAAGAGHVLGTIEAMAVAGERPLVAALDGALQLAAYWAVAQHGRGGLPVGVAELHLLREPTAGESLRCLGLLRAGDGETLAGDLDLVDASGALVLALRGLRAELRDIGRAGRPLAGVPAEHVDIAQFPEVKELEQRLSMAAAMGISNPYFRSFEGTNADTAVTGGRTLVNFSSYNYLGLSGHPEVNRAVTDAVARYGTSVSASRIASGQRPLHDQLEAEIARLLGTEAAFVMVGGHATNVSVIGHLLGPEDLVVHDSLAHDSILGGVRLSGARRRPFAHNDPDALERILKETRAGVRRVLIAIEGVYSMDGDIAPLDRFIEIKKRYGAMLFVDEAHSLGVLGQTGRGVGEHFAVNPADVDLWMGTMSKSLASCGGYIAGSRALVNFLRYTVPGFVYSVGISPANAAAALAAVRLIEKHPELPQELQRKSRLFLELCRARGVDTGMSEGSAVVPCIVGNSYACLQLSQALEARGINVQPILYPAVEENMARLRFFVSVTHSEEQLARTADILAEEYHQLVRPTRPPAAARASASASGRAET